MTTRFGLAAARTEVWVSQNKENGGVAQWLERRSLAGGLSLIYA